MERWRLAVLLDRRFFLLDEKVYKRFTVALDKPPSDNPKLRRLLASKAPWESRRARGNPDPDHGP